MSPPLAPKSVDFIERVLVYRYHLYAKFGIPYAKVLE